MTKLPSNILEKRAALPEKPSSVSLQGQYVRLEPLLLERDAEKLFAMSNGSAIQLGKRSMPCYDPEALIWRYMFDGPFNTLDAFKASLKTQIEASNGRCFTVFDLATGVQVGIINLMNNAPAHLKIELGGIWYSPIVQKTLANTETVYIMLKHCFDLGYRRVEWKCHSLNERSRKAALRLGFTFEGIQECHMIVKESNRDTAWFRMLDHEWPAFKQNLETLISLSGGLSHNSRCAPSGQ